MNKRNLNVIELIVQLVALILLWVDGMFLGEANIMLSFMMASSEATFVSLLVIALFVFNGAICFISAFKNTAERDSLLHTILPIVNMIIFFATGPMLALSVIYINDIELVVRQVDTLYTVTLFVLLVIVVLSIIKRSRSVVPEKEAVVSQVVNNIQEQSSADELAKYKNLLDSGIITQEEFEQKKKQLLGL